MNFSITEKFKQKKILSPHIKATLERIKKEPVVLLPQDTSSLNYTSKPSIKDLGNIGSSNTKGYFVHPLLAITPSRINLGIIDAKIWTRDLEKEKRTDHETYALPIEEKEKFRWIESYRVACEVAKECPDTQIIAMTDREGDKVTFKKRSTGKNSDYPSVTINAVMAIEENPPEGLDPLIWVLLTTLPVDTFQQIALVIQYYLCRWEIEVFFKTLKSGCNVEERRLTEGAIVPLIAIFLIIAWKIMYAMKMGRSCPEMSCECIFSASEWKSVHKVLKKGIALPEEPPSLEVFIKMIATLGGYLNRKNDPPPGPKTMWIGFNRMYDFALAWESFGQP